MTLFSSQRVVTLVGTTQYDWDTTNVCYKLNENTMDSRALNGSRSASRVVAAADQRPFPLLPLQPVDNSTAIPPPKVLQTMPWTKLDDGMEIDLLQAHDMANTDGQLFVEVTQMSSTYFSSGGYEVTLDVGALLRNSLQVYGITQFQNQYVRKALFMVTGFIPDLPVSRFTLKWKLGHGHQPTSIDDTYNIIVSASFTSFGVGGSWKPVLP